MRSLELQSPKLYESHDPSHGQATAKEKEKEIFIRETCEMSLANDNTSGISPSRSSGSRLGFQRTESRDAAGRLSADQPGSPAEHTLHTFSGLTGVDIDKVCTVCWRYGRINMPYQQWALPWTGPLHTGTACRWLSLALASGRHGVQGSGTTENAFLMTGAPSEPGKVWYMRLYSARAILFLQNSQHAPR